MLRSLERTVRPLEKPFDYAASVRGEAYLHLWALRNLRQLGGLGGLTTALGAQTPRPPSPEYSDGNDVAGLAERSMAVRSFEFWTDFARAAKERPGDPVAQSEYLDDRAREVERSGSSSHTLLKILLPVFTQSGVSMVKAQAVARATRSALIAWAERAEGRQASSLSRVPGGPWIDPFSEEEFKAKFEKEKVLIWSVGNDGKDQAGAPDTVLTQTNRSDQFLGDDVAVQIPDLALLKKK